MEGGLARVEDGDLVHVAVHAEDLVAEFGYAGGVGGAEVAAADHGLLHERSFARWAVDDPTSAPPGKGGVLRRAGWPGSG